MGLGLQGRKAIVCAASKGLGKACAFLCAASSGYIVGQNLLLDGGAFNSTLG